MELNDIKSVFFVGAGGIGMSAIARYFMHIGISVAVTTKHAQTLLLLLKKKV